MNVIPCTQLIIRPDGSIFHLHLKPEDIADTILLVGDPGRVPELSALFDHVELKIQNREFMTHTGICKGKRITALSTGIGIDNIDIVMNELDALVNTDFETRIVKKELRRLNIIRLGTSGAIQPGIPLNSFVMASYAMGMDTMMRFYSGFRNVTDKLMEQEFKAQTDWKTSLSTHYFVKGTEKWIRKFESETITGITATAPGFYGPQGRSIRLELEDDALISKLQAFSHDGLRILNFEMEAAALYAMGAMLGHDVVTICAVIANRETQAFNPDYKNVMHQLYRLVLDKISED